jgi:hypothetical protein
MTRQKWKQYAAAMAAVPTILLILKHGQYVAINDGALLLRRYCRLPIKEYRAGPIYARAAFDPAALRYVTGELIGNACAWRIVRYDPERKDYAKAQKKLIE